MKDFAYFSKTSTALLISGFASLFTASAGASAATNLYVSTVGKDTNAGTSSTAPLRTIQRAATLAKPGYVINVAPGTYVETITATVSGTSTARIRFVSTQKYGAILRPLSGARTMWSQKGGYTDIDGFQINGAGSTTVRTGIYMTGGNSSVRNSWVHDVATNSGCDNRGGAGILNDQYRGKSYSNYQILNNRVHNVGGGCSYIQGIYHNSSGMIMNNVVSAASTGINLGHDNNNTLIMNNTLIGNRLYGVRYGSCKEAYNMGCPTRGIRVHNNIIYGNGGGIQGPVAAEDVGNSVANNLVYSNRTNFDLSGSSSSTKTGIISADPKFVSYLVTGNGDYHLQTTSPVINKGLTTNAPITDFDGKTRGARIDFGAYESNLN